jgi:hypothetical protein
LPPEALLTAFDCGQPHEGDCASEAAPSNRMGVTISREVSWAISEPVSAAAARLPLLRNNNALAATRFTLTPQTHTRITKIGEPKRVSNPRIRPVTQASIFRAKCRATSVRHARFSANLTRVDLGDPPKVWPLLRLLDAPRG